MADSELDIKLLGSEMLTWSDLDASGGFDSVLATSLVSSFARRPNRMLIAGPTSAEVIGALVPEAARVDVLVRSWPDAQRLREVLPSDVAVHCGPLDRMSAEAGGYDAVVALAGLDRLSSAEEPTPAWLSVLSDLAGLVAPTGELLVAVDSSVGVDTLTTAGHHSRHEDAAWPQGQLPSPPPAKVEEVLQRLASEHQLLEVETWSCHGPRLRPHLVASRRAVTERSSDPLLLRMVTHAYDSKLAGEAVALRDPGRTAADLVEAGLGIATAPLRVLHVSRGHRGATTSRPSTMLVAEHERVDGSPVVYRLEHTDDGWNRGLVVPAGRHQVAPGLRRDLGRLQGQVPSGHSVADELRALLGQHDASGAGDLVRQVRDWIEGDDHDEVEPERIAATLDRVVLDETLQLVDASYLATVDADRDVVLARMLLRFAHAMLLAGARHPWSAAASPRAVATSLAAAADLQLGDDVFARAVSLDRRLSDPRVTEPDFEAPGGGDLAMPYAELLELSRGLAEHAAAQDAHVLWLLRVVQLRQRRYRRSRRKVEELTQSREYRLGRRIFWLRDLRRRRRDSRAQASAQLGEWRGRVEEAPEQPVVFVEEDLVPPGYQPQEGVVITPVGVDPGEEDDD